MIVPFGPVTATPVTELPALSENLHAAAGPAPFTVAFALYDVPPELKYTFHSAEMKTLRRQGHLEVLQRHLHTRSVFASGDENTTL